MSSAMETQRLSRFACTSCGACCNRPPEVELSEAAALADMFVFRLMFRLYQLPRTPGAGSSEAHYESRRLLTAFAARKHGTKRKDGGTTVELVNYLTISAQGLDLGSGACSALRDRRCTIYARRPLACRSVPFHYSRPEALAEAGLEAFVATPGHRCDTGSAAPVVLAAGKIVDLHARQARSAALALAGQDRPWKEAILRRMKAGAERHALPSLHDIEANALFGATTTSMRVAWQIAADAGLIDAATCRALIAAQAAAIDRALADAACTASARATLVEMRAEHRQLVPKKRAGPKARPPF